MIDILIQNGRIFDGIGTPSTMADVAISNGKVVSIGTECSASAALIIDAQGKWVVPGFIGLESVETVQEALSNGLTTMAVKASKPAMKSLNIVTMISHRELLLKVNKKLSGGFDSLQQEASDALQSGYSGIVTDLLAERKAEVIRIVMLCAQWNAILQVKISPENSWLDLVKLCRIRHKGRPLKVLISDIDSYVPQDRWRLLPVLFYVLNNLLGGNVRGVLGKGIEEYDAHLLRILSQSVVFPIQAPLSFLRQVITTPSMSIERAISKCTAEPAAWFGLSTGVLEITATADLVVLNPQRLHSNDVRAAIETVIVQGNIVWEAGRVTTTVNETEGKLLTLCSSVEPRKLHRRSSRNRINDIQLDHPFENYWDVFVLKHQEPMNVFFHVLGMLYGYGLIVAAILYSPWLLLLMPLSNLIGLLGHLFYERSHIDVHDALYDLRAGWCLNKLLYFVVTRRYSIELQRVRGEYEAYLKNNRSASLSL